MKKVLFLFLLLVGFAQQADSQIFSKYKRGLNKVEKANKKALQSGNADFVLDPIESVPKNVQSFAAAATQTNWGVKLLLPDDLRQRLIKSAKYPVYIKVYDTMGKTNHSDLQKGQVPGTNYTSSKTLDDLQGHGTHVTGIMYWLLEDLFNAGLAQYQGIKILSDEGRGDFQWVANAIAAEREHDIYLLSQNKYVICNGSFGGGTTDVPFVDAELSKSTKEGVVFVYAAGNTGTAGVNYPGRSRYAMACASLDETLIWSNFSSYGSEVWFAFPGRNINSTYKNNTFASLSGTSMSAPASTAVIAWAYSIWGPKLKGTEKIKAYMAWIASDLGPVGKDDKYGNGIAYLESVLDKDPANMPTTPAPPPPPTPPSPPTRETRTLTFTMPENYNIVYTVAGSAAQSAAEFEPKTFKTAGKGSKKANIAAGVNTITITRIEIATTANTTAPEMYAATTAATKWFFTNRGLGLAANADYADGVYYAAYFLEMLLKTQKGLDTDIVRIEAKDASGNTVTFTGDKLRRWPLK